MVAGPAYQHIGKQVGEFFVALLNQFEVLFKVWRVYWQVGLIILMEEFELRVNVPSTLIAWCGR